MFKMFHFMRGSWGWDAWDKSCLSFELPHALALCGWPTRAQHFGKKAHVESSLWGHRSPPDTHSLCGLHSGALLRFDCPHMVNYQDQVIQLHRTPSAACFRWYAHSQMLLQWRLEEAVISACRAITDKWLIEQEAVNHLLTNVPVEMSLPSGAMRRGLITVPCFLLFPYRWDFQSQCRETTNRSNMTRNWFRHMLYFTSQNSFFFKIPLLILFLTL